jgi:hypothetical protein
MKSPPPFLLTAHVAAGARVSSVKILRRRDGRAACTPRPGACRARPREHRGPTRPRAPASGRLKARKGFVPRSLVLAAYNDSVGARFFCAVSRQREDCQVLDCDAIFRPSRRDRRDRRACIAREWTVRQRQMLSANPCMLTVLSPAHAGCFATMRSSTLAPAAR